MLFMNKEDLKKEVAESLKRYKLQVGKGRLVRAMEVNPHRPPALRWVGNDLPSLYCAVGGPYEVVPLEDGVALVCNEIGKLLGLPANRALFVEGEACPYDVVAGTFLVMGDDLESGELVDLTDEALEKYAKIFADPICRWGYRI